MLQFQFFKAYCHLCWISLRGIVDQIKKKILNLKSYRQLFINFCTNLVWIWAEATKTWHYSFSQLQWRSNLSDRIISRGKRGWVFRIFGHFWVPTPRRGWTGLSVKVNLHCSLRSGINRLIYFCSLSKFSKGCIRRYSCPIVRHIKHLIYTFSVTELPKSFLEPHLPIVQHFFLYNKICIKIEKHNMHKVCF